MKILKIFLAVSLLALASCKPERTTPSLHSLLDDLPSYSGTAEYLSSPYVAAGDRVYSVGHQDGSFPDLGWHVAGEMGGVWNHPIKLMDGYQLAIGTDELTCLNAAKQFINYPVGNKHVYEEVEGVTTSRFQFAPDGLEGLIVEYQLQNNSSNTVNLSLAFTAHFDLRPVWLAEEKNLADGQDSFTQEGDLIIAKDSLNEWYAVLTSGSPITSVNNYSPCTLDNAGLGTAAIIHQELELAPKQSKTVQYFISGSYNNKEAAVSTNQNLKNEAKALLDSKINRLNKLNEFNKLTSPNADINAMYEWIKYNNDWLMRDVPEVGKGISAGIPDYPWWFGTDAGYAIEGLLAQGQWDDALSTIDLISKLSEQANGDSGKIMHEASTNGIVFNPGNLNTTPRFIQTLWMTYSWTGKAELLTPYYELVQKGITWIESQDKDGNGYADGPGMMEIHGLHTEMIDVVAYQEQAYRAAANFAEVSKDNDRAKEYLQKAGELREKINSEWWSEEFSSYADFRATTEQAIELTESAIVRADSLQKPWAVAELEATLDKISSSDNDATQAHVVHHNWVVNTPLETGSADPEKAIKALKTSEKYQNRFGMFVTGIDRNKAQEEATKWKAFSYVGAVMTLPTGVQAIGAAKYGNSNLSYQYLKKLENSFSYALPGSMYEVSPDFGMVTQAWNNYAVAVPIVQYYFGITPLAHEQKIIWKPQFPIKWEEGKLENIKVGDNLITLNCTSNQNGELSWIITQSQPDWTIELQLDMTEITVNDESLENQNGGFTLMGKEIKISY